MTPQPDDIAAHLRAAQVRDVVSDSTSRAAYSSDASLYRVLPKVIARPRDSAEVAAILHICRELGVPLTCRGAGTSVAGNAIGPGVIVDFSRHMNRVILLDPEQRTARVQPGAVHAALQKVAAPHGLRFGPDPSTHTRCTIGGMIGNNACGARTLGYGRTVDNVIALIASTGLGNELRLTAGHTPPGHIPELDVLQRVVSGSLATIRTEFGTFGRQASGYSLEHLLPENKFDVARMLVGSEGTLAVLTEATIRLVTTPLHRVLLVLGFPDIAADIAAAGDAAPTLLRFAPTACEGIDSRIVEVVRSRRGPGAVPHLPRGQAWLFVETVGDTHGAALATAQQMAAVSQAMAFLIVQNPTEAAALWRIREDGAGLAGRSSSTRRTRRLSTQLRIPHRSALRSLRGRLHSRSHRSTPRSARRTAGVSSISLCCSHVGCSIRRILVR